MMKFLRTQMKWIMIIIVIAFLLSTFLMYEGRGTRRSPGVNADGTMTDYEVAQINGRSLMRSELERRRRNYLENYSGRNIASLDMAVIYQSVLDQAILESQLNKEVEDRGIKVTDVEAEAAMKAYADRYYPTRETFYQYLANAGIKREDYRKNLARQMAVNILVNEAIGEVDVSEDKALEFYDSMKNFVYIKPAGYMIHLADFSDEAEAEKFYSEISGGESWDVVANRTSGDKLLNITHEPVFLRADTISGGALKILDSLDVGQLSNVFEISSGDYGVGLKTEYIPERTDTYDEVSSDIRALLQQQEERQRLNDFQAGLMSKAQVIINDPSLFAKVNEEKPEEDPLKMPEIILDEPEEDGTDEIKSDDVKTEELKPEAENISEVKEVEEVKEAEEADGTDEIKSDDVKTEEPKPEAENISEVEEAGNNSETSEDIITPQVQNEDEKNEKDEKVSE